MEAPGPIIGTGFLRKEGERREKGFTVFVPSGGHRRCVYRHPGADLSGDHLAVQQLFRVFLCFLHSAQRVGSSLGCFSTIINIVVITLKYFSYHFTFFFVQFLSLIHISGN